MLTDLRHATRALLRSPGFTATAVVTLAVGIGGSAAIFTLVNRVVLNPLPFRDADRLVLLWGSKPMLRSLLFGVAPADVPTIAGAVVLMFHVGMAAGYLPARRATRVDPLAALRTE
jgi:ABC-type antimicrobial peptide transport system permease subunit